MKKLSFAMFVIVGLFMLFSGIHSVYGGGKQQAKEAVIVKQVKVGGGPVCLSENTPLVFYDRSMDIIEVIFTSGTESKTGLLVISGNYGQVTEQFDLFNGKSIIPIPGTSHRNHRKTKEFIFLIISYLHISYFLHFCPILPVFCYSVHF